MDEPTLATICTNPSAPTPTRLSRELRGLHTYYNPVLDRTDNDQVQIEDDTEPEGQGVQDEEAALFPEFAFLSVLSGAMDPTRFNDYHGGAPKQ